VSQSLAGDQQFRARRSRVAIRMSTCLTGRPRISGCGCAMGARGVRALQPERRHSGRSLELIAYDDATTEADGPTLRRLSRRTPVIAIIGRRNGRPPSLRSHRDRRRTRSSSLPTPAPGSYARPRPTGTSSTTARATPRRPRRDRRPDRRRRTAARRDRALHTQRDAYGTPDSPARRALKRHADPDASSIPHLRYERNSLPRRRRRRVPAAAETPKAVVMVGTYAPCSKFIEPW